jgi:Rieske Fe-S protein
MKQFLLAISLLSSLVQANTNSFPENYNNEKLIEAKASVFVDTKLIAHGEVSKFEYAGMPIFVYRRTKEDIQFLKKIDKSELADPKDENFFHNIKRTYESSTSQIWARLYLFAKPISNKKYSRSINDEIAVLARWSSETGCLLRFIKPSDRTNLNALFLDPCSKTTYDSAGHIFAGHFFRLGVHRTNFSNLIVPPYTSNKSGIHIGIKPHTQLPHLPFSKLDLYDRSTPTQVLISAAKYNDMATVKSALKSGADVNYSKTGLASPIDAAILGSSIEIVKMLIDLGAKPTERTAALINILKRADIAPLFGISLSTSSMQ